MTQNFLLVTGNESKANEIRPIFSALDAQIFTLSDLGITARPVEDGSSEEENSRKKIAFGMVHAPHGYIVISDDTGLHLSALGGAPGHHAARWAGDSATTSEVTQHTLRQLEGKGDRGALFVTVAGLGLPDGSIRTFRGELSGWIYDREAVDPRPQMPYSGIFIPNGLKNVLAEMPIEEENKISHRGKAFRLLIDELKKHL